MEIRLLIALLFCYSACAAHEQALEALTQFLQRPLSPCLRVEKLKGMTNQSYWIQEEGDEGYVVRIPGKGTHYFIDRLAEHKNSSEAFAHHFHPVRPLFYEAKGHIAITRYRKNFTQMAFEDFYEEKTMKKVAHMLRQVHTSSMDFSNEINIFTRIASITKLLRPHEEHFPPYYFLAKDYIATLQAQGNALHFTKCPCHSDPVPSNFVAVDDQLMLFDWEYSGLADPAWDLAFFFSVMNYSPKRQQRFLALYGEHDEEALTAKISYFMPIVEFWLGLWGLLQTTLFERPLEKAFFRYFAIARFSKALAHKELS